MQNITDVIIQLQKLKDKYGDLKVCQLSFPNSDYSDTIQKYVLNLAIVTDPLDKNKLIVIVD